MSFHSSEDSRDSELLEGVCNGQIVIVDVGRGGHTYRTYTMTGNPETDKQIKQMIKEKKI